MKTILQMTRPDSPDRLDLTEDLVLAAYRGSHAHGLYVPPEDPTGIDDTDIIAFAVPEKRHCLGLRDWGSRGTREFWVGHYDCVYYELRKAFRLLLQGNPNILTMLWLHPASYLVRQIEGDLLVASRDVFVGKHVYQAFSGYAYAQLLKMESRTPAEIREYLGLTYELKSRGAHPTDQELPKDLGDYTDCSEWSTEKLAQRLKHYMRKGENLGYLGDKRKKLVLEHGYDAKNAAHCIRLLRLGREFLECGSMTVYRTTDRDELLEIKAGKWPLTQVKQLAEDLFQQTKMAYERSPLPDGPRTERAEELLVAMIEGYWGRAHPDPLL